MLEVGMKAPEFTLSDVARSSFTIDAQGKIEKVMHKAKPDTNAAEILQYLAGDA